MGKMEQWGKGGSQQLAREGHDIDSRLHDEQEKLKGSKITIENPYWYEHLHDSNRFYTKDALEALGAIEKIKERKAANVEEAKEYLPSLEDEAKRYSEEWEVYAEAQKRLAAELGIEPAVLKMNGFIDTRDEVGPYWTKRPDGGGDKFIEDLQGREAEIAAAIDLLKPKVGKVIEWSDGSEIEGYSRLPRMEVGTDLDTSLVNAEAKGLDHILKITLDRKKAVSSTYWPVVESSDVYVPISKETAELLAIAGLSHMDDHATLYKKGAYRDWPAFTGALESQFKVMSVEEAKKEVLSQKITLTYEAQDWRTNASKSMTQVFDGRDIGDIYDQVAAHLIKLEMDPASTVIAKNTMIKIGGKEMTFDEFGAMARGQAA